MVKIIFCGYRDWAVKIIDSITKHPKVNCISKIFSKEEYEQKKDSFPSDIDFILFLGWSWIIPPEITSKFLCLGIHPSDLPFFRGGSPIQHQILYGIKQSKVSLMTLSSKKLDGGEIWIKENLDLSGDDMNAVFKNLVDSTIRLLNHFIDDYQNIKPVEQDISKGSYYKRRKPEESLITLKEINGSSLEELYNKIRCLTDPYPNAFLEDTEGNRLYFKKVSYVAKE